VSAHAEASIDVFEEAGERDLVLVPEHVARLGDAVHLADAPRLRRRPGESEADYRERRDRTQGRRAVKRAKTGFGALARALRRKRSKSAKKTGQTLEVLTAGDDDVCPICEELALRTYSISEARGVLPAHPECRCIWITLGSMEEEE
jgi:ribosomal protein L44E